MEDQPKPAASPAGTIAFAEYPNRNPQQPSPDRADVAGHADGSRMPDDELLLNLFFDNIASDATSNLYKKFIDSKTRTIDIGAKTVGNRVSADQGHPVSIFFGDVAATNLTAEKLAEVRKVVTDEIARIASLPDGSPELEEFNKRDRRPRRRAASRPLQVRQLAAAVRLPQHRLGVDGSAADAGEDAARSRSR